MVQQTDVGIIRKISKRQVGLRMMEGRVRLRGVQGKDGPSPDSGIDRLKSLVRPDIGEG